MTQLLRLFFLSAYSSMSACFMISFRLMPDLQMNSFASGFHPAADFLNLSVYYPVFTVMQNTVCKLLTGGTLQTLPLSDLLILIHQGSAGTSDHKLRIDLAILNLLSLRRLQRLTECGRSQLICTHLDRCQRWFHGPGQNKIIKTGDCNITSNLQSPPFDFPVSAERHHIIGKCNSLYIRMPV